MSSRKPAPSRATINLERQGGVLEASSGLVL